MYHGWRILPQNHLRHVIYLINTTPYDVTRRERINVGNFNSPLQKTLQETFILDCSLIVKSSLLIRKILKCLLMILSVVHRLQIRSTFKRRASMATF